MALPAPSPESDFLARRRRQENAKLAELLARTAQRDHQAFALLYKRTSAKLFGLCLRICNDRQEAEDMVQDAYLTIWNKAALYDAAKAAPMGWLLALTRNRAIDKLRSAGRARPGASLELVAEIADDTPGAEGDVQAAQQGERLHDCLRGLTKGDAAMLTDAYFGGATYQQLAQQAGRPLPTVKSRIRRALLRLRDCLGERGDYVL